VTHQRKEGIKTPKDEWETPDWLFVFLDREFDFRVDAAARKHNTKTGLYFEDALSVDWAHQGGINPSYFLNPPYSAGNISRFMKKAYEESLKGAVVVCLVPVASDTAWWHTYVMKADEIRFIKGRVKFIGYDEQGKPIRNSPTFSSCVVIFREMYKKRFTPYIGKTIEQPGKVRS
jgi:site-specific DNA-methyltransferase (adenine-specific)